MPNNRKGPFRIFKHSFRCEISKNSKEPFGDIKKTSKKVALPEQNRKEDSLVSSGVVGYVKKVKNERGPYALSFRWPESALVVLADSVKIDLSVIGLSFGSL